MLIKDLSQALVNNGKVSKYLNQEIESELEENAGIRNFRIPALDGKNSCFIIAP